MPFRVLVPFLELGPEPQPWKLHCPPHLQADTSGILRLANRRQGNLTSGKNLFYDPARPFTNGTPHSTSQAKQAPRSLENNCCYNLNHNKTSKLKQSKLLYSGENKRRPSRRPAWLPPATLEFFLNKWLGAFLQFSARTERLWLHVHHDEKPEKSCQSQIHFHVIITGLPPASYWLSRCHCF